MAEPQNPSPNFYKLMALLCVVVGAWLILQAVVQRQWVFWALAIITLANGYRAWRKSLPPREPKNP